jgi:hypothetical protein
MTALLLPLASGAAGTVANQVLVLVLVLGAFGVVLGAFGVVLGAFGVVLGAFGVVLGAFGVALISASAASFHDIRERLQPE